MNTGSCLLCKNERSLHDSHIAPAFVFRYFKETAVSGMRSVGTPNKREQDGPTREWLCSECEKRFELRETPFAKHFFRPVNDQFYDPQVAQYGSWAEYFAASVSWRSLQFCLDLDLSYLTNKDRELLDTVEEVWRRYLLGETDSVGPYWQGFLVFYPVVLADQQVSPVLNQFLSRAVIADIVAAEDFCVIFSKLMGMGVIGIIRLDRPDLFSDTRIGSIPGKVGISDNLPISFYQYLSERADYGQSRLDSISDPQREKIANVFKRMDANTFWDSSIGKARIIDNLRDGISEKNPHDHGSG